MTNVANRDDALRCLQIAKQALRDDDVVKAQRFAAKARRLCDCKEVSAFLSELGSQASSNGNPSDGPSTSTEQSDSACMGAGLRHRNGAAPDSSNEATSRPSGPNSAAKKEQEEFVAKILRHRDFYEILGIAKDADDEEIKKAYKKLALKLHPDKNKAPKAEEAFKAVSRAFSCLSDPEKRSNYDRYGHEDRAQAAAAAAAARGAHGMHNFYAEEIDPMEIFNMFFGVGLHHPQARVFRTHHRTRGFRHQAESANQSINFVSLMHILPILVLFMYTFFSGPSEPLYKLSRDSHFKEEMTTKRFSIPFFVKSSTQFEKDFPVGGYYRAQVELQIESSYHETLEHLCREERLKQRRTMWKGTEEAKKMELTHCNKLKETFRTALYVQ